MNRISKNSGAPLKSQLDWIPIALPFAVILLLCGCFFAAPESSRQTLDSVRAFLGDQFGVWYLAVGLGFFLLSIYLAFSPYGSIRLGKPAKSLSILPLFGVP